MTSYKVTPCGHDYWSTPMNPALPLCWASYRFWCDYNTQNKWQHCAVYLQCARCIEQSNVCAKFQGHNQGFIEKGGRGGWLPVLTDLYVLLTFLNMQLQSCKWKPSSLPVFAIFPAWAYTHQKFMCCSKQNLYTGNRNSSARKYRNTGTGMLGW